MDLGALIAARTSAVRCPLCGTDAPDLGYTLTGHDNIDVCYRCWRDFGPDRHT